MNAILKHTGTIISIVVVAMLIIIVLWYGNTEVAFKVQDDMLYWQIKNGRVGTNCYDGDGTKVIAPSRVAGPDWMPVASLEDISKDGKTYSITCFPYTLISDASPVSATISLVGNK